MDINKKSRRDVSEAIGVSYYTFTDWVNGKKYPRMDKVEKLADYFGILKSDLIEDKKEKSVTQEDDGLTENQRILMEFAKSVPDDKAAMVLKVIQSIVESD
jgi:repressor LexA